MKIYSLTYYWEDLGSPEKNGCNKESFYDSKEKAEKELLKRIEDIKKDESNTDICLIKDDNSCTIVGIYYNDVWESNSIIIEENDVLKKKDNIVRKGYIFYHLGVLRLRFKAIETTIAYRSSTPYIKIALRAK